MQNYVHQDPRADTLRGLAVIVASFVVSQVLVWSVAEPWERILLRTPPWLRCPALGLAAAVAMGPRAVRRRGTCGRGRVRGINSVEMSIGVGTPTNTRGSPNVLDTFPTKVYLTKPNILDKAQTY